MGCVISIGYIVGYFLTYKNKDEGPRTVWTNVPIVIIPNASIFIILYVNARIYCLAGESGFRIDKIRLFLLPFLIALYWVLATLMLIVNLFSSGFSDGIVSPLLHVVLYGYPLINWLIYGKMMENLAKRQSLVREREDSNRSDVTPIRRDTDQSLRSAVNL